MWVQVGGLGGDEQGVWSRNCENRKKRDYVGCLFYTHWVCVVSWSTRFLLQNGILVVSWSVYVMDESWTSQEDTGTSFLMSLSINKLFCFEYLTYCDV